MISERTIYKYQLAGSYIRIRAPIEKFLSVQLQNGITTVWAIVNPEVEEQTYLLYKVGTGWPLKGIRGTYLGTVQDWENQVWHVFAGVAKENPSAKTWDYDTEAIYVN